MRNLAGLLTAVLFFIWLLPLGIFIKPSNEKVACGGQRAVCLCHISTAKSSSKPLEQAAGLRAGPSANKEASASAGHYFAPASSLMMASAQLASVFEHKYLSYKNPYLASLEHVPKA